MGVTAVHDLEARYLVKTMDAERAVKQSRWPRELFADRVKRALEHEKATPEPGAGREPAKPGVIARAGGRLARRTP